MPTPLRDPKPMLDRVIERMGRPRGPLGVRLRLADLAPRVRLHRAASGAGARLAPGAQDVEPRQPRHGREPGPGVRPALGRQLPRHGVPRAGRRRAGNAGPALAARDAHRRLRPELARLRARRTARCARWPSPCRGAAPTSPATSTTSAIATIFASAVGRYGSSLDYAQPDAAGTAGATRSMTRRWRGWSGWPRPGCRRTPIAAARAAPVYPSASFIPIFIQGVAMSPRLDRPRPCRRARRSLLAGCGTMSAAPQGERHAPRWRRPRRSRRTRPWAT